MNKVRAYLRRGQVEAWLGEELGLSEWQVRGLIACGAIKQVQFYNAQKRAYFSRDQILRDVVKRAEQTESLKERAG